MDSQETTQSFGKRIYENLLDSLTILNISLGSRLGLFDTLATFDAPKSSEEIASISGYNKRCIKEWLEMMVMSDILESDSDKGMYFLPHNRRPVLAGRQRSTLPTLATRWLPVLASPQKQIMEAFKPDGPLGTTYDVYPDFHETLNLMREVVFTEDIFNDAFKMIPDLKSKLEHGIALCEVGTGNGTISLYFGKAFPNSTITGLDLNPEVVKELEDKAFQKGLENVRGVVQNVCEIPDSWADTYDYIFICNTIHDIPFATECVRNLYKILKPGGYISVIEMICSSSAHDSTGVNGKFTYGHSVAHCLPISMNYPGSEALGAAWGKERCRKMLEDVGFKDYTFIDDYETEYHCVLRK